MTGQTLVAILGPTASGKSALGIALAERHNGEIVSCDSTAVYRGFDIGTDKVSVEERRGIPHHLVDVADPCRGVFRRAHAREAAAVIHANDARGRLPILVGGTGFYYRALARVVCGAGTRRGDARAAGRHRAPSRSRAAAPAARPYRSGVGRAHPTAGREAHDPRARGVFPNRPSADRSLRRHGIAASSRTTSRVSCLNPPAAEIAERVARRVDAQFARGIVAEVGGCGAQGFPRPRCRSPVSCIGRSSSTSMACETSRTRARSSCARTSDMRGAS